MPRPRRGRPRRAHFLIDARVSTAVTRASRKAVETTDGRSDGTMREAPTTRTFVRRALERVVDASGKAEFAIRACDGDLAPHAFDGALRRMGETGTSTSGAGAGGFTFGKFYATSATRVRDGLTAFERVETAYEENDVPDDASTTHRGVSSLKEWLVNLTRNVGAATNDFADISGFGSSFGMDDEHAGTGGEVDDYNVLFILTPLPRVSDEEVKQLDGAQVLKSFRGVEERFKKDKIKAHLLFVGEKPRDAFAGILREIFRKLNGAVFPLDAACRLAPWVPLFDTLESYGDAVGKDDQTKTPLTTTPSVVPATDRTTSTVDILVQTRPPEAGLRLGEAHQVGASERRDVTLSIVGFVDKADVPSTSLALESQTIMSFSDSPIRALLAMLVMKDAVCAVRREAGQSHQMAILAPLTCASFTITLLKADAIVPPIRDATEDSLRREMDDLLSRRSNLETLESITGLLEKLRDDVRAKIISPAATQELALAQTSDGGLSQRDYRDDIFPAAPSSQDVRTLEDAFAADQYRGASQSASRLEAWYGTQDLTPAVRKVLRSIENNDEIAQTDALKAALDERFRKMIKAQNGIVSPPRKSRARRSLGATLNEFALLGDVERWAGSADDVVNAAKLQYDEFVATLSDEPNGLDPNLHDFAAKTLHRLRLSLGDIDMDELFERLARATVVDAKALKLKYVKNKCKAAKRREYVLQAHVALRIALIKMELMRDGDGSSEDPEALEGRVMDKKEMKKLVKSVNKLIDEIRFLLTPADRAGVVALMESDFAPNYTGSLPETMRLLKIELGVSDDAVPERASDSLALTPFSPQPLRRSPRKPKQPDRLTYDDVKHLPPPSGGGEKKKPPLPKQPWHWLARSNSMRAITRAVPVTGNASTSFAPPKPKVSRGSTARHAYPMATPLPRGAGHAVASTPAMTRPMVSRIGETPATRPRSGGMIAETPVGTQFGPPSRRGGGGAVLSTPISGCDISRALQFSAATPGPTKRTSNAGLHSPDPKKSRLGS